MSTTKKHWKLIDLLHHRECHLSNGGGAMPPWQEYHRFSSLEPFVSRLKLSRKLEGHEGCVNSLVWNEKGTRLLSGSDDTRLKVWDIEQTDDYPPSYGAAGATSVMTTDSTTIETGHATNIFCAKFMSFSNDRRIVSCSADGSVKYLDLDATPVVRPFNCHTNMAFEVLPDPENPNIFFSCSEDGTVRQFDLRLKDHCDCDGCSHGTYIKLHGTRNRPVGILTMAMRPLRSTYLSVGCVDGLVRTYDRRMVSTVSDENLNNSSGSHSNANEQQQGLVYHFCPEHLMTPPDKRHRITSLKYNHDGHQMIVSYSGEHIYLVEPESQISSNDLKEIRQRWQNKLKTISESASSSTTATESSTNHDVSSRPHENISLASSTLIEQLFRLRDHRANSNTTDSPSFPSPTSIRRSRTTADHEDEEIDDDDDQSRPTNHHGGSHDATSSPSSTHDLPRSPSPNTSVGGHRSSSSDPQGTVNSGHLIGHRSATTTQGSSRSSQQGPSRVKRPRNGTSPSATDESTMNHLADRDIRMVYCGHRNVRTMIKEANFFGAYSQYVVSGSDDGRVFVWDRDSGDLVNLFTGDKRVVNCVQGHPLLPILAVSGIDKDIKLFEPLADSPVDLASSLEIMRRNQRRLQEHQDVLVVPASIVLHLLSLLPGQPANITLTFSSLSNVDDDSGDEESNDSSSSSLS
jgi:WD40 repeat protein